MTGYKGLKDGSLFTCGEGGGRYYIFDGIFAPYSFFQDVLICHPPPSECAEFWPPPRCLSPPSLEESMTSALPDANHVLKSCSNKGKS